MYFILLKSVLNLIENISSTFSIPWPYLFYHIFLQILPLKSTIAVLQLLWQGRQHFQSHGGAWVHRRLHQNLACSASLGHLHQMTSDGYTNNVRMTPLTLGLPAKIKRSKDKRVKLFSYRKDRNNSNSLKPKSRRNIIMWGKEQLKKDNFLH